MGPKPECNDKYNEGKIGLSATDTQYDTVAVTVLTNHLHYDGTLEDAVYQIKTIRMYIAGRTDVDLKDKAEHYKAEDDEENFHSDWARQLMGNYHTVTRELHGTINQK